MSYARRSTYRNDPYWLEARRAGVCAKDGCTDEIKPGDRIFWYPRAKQAYVGPCAEAASRDFTSHAEDEDLYLSGFGVG